jgi:hypothetical protein
MYRLNRFIKCAGKISASARFGARCCTSVIQHKSTVTTSGNFARNHVFKTHEQPTHRSRLLLEPEAVAAYVR